MARARPGTPAISGFATATSPPSAISTERRRTQDHRRARAWWWLRASSTCWGSRSSRSWSNPHLPSKIYQGITTEITGEGDSAAPLNDAIRQGRPRRLTSTTASAGLEHLPRSISRGWKNRASASTWPVTSARRRCGAWCWATTIAQPTPAELDRMKALVRASHAGGRGGRIDVAAVRAGALRHHRGTDRAGRGSRRNSAAFTPPTCAAKATRSSTAIDEAIRIGREAHIPVEIWHLKAAGKSNWGRMPEIVAHIEAGARRRRRCRGRHLRLPGLVQLLSPRSFRRGRTMAATPS